MTRHSTPIISGVSIAAILTGLLTGVTTSEANWNDSEFNYADATTVNCATATALDSRARGRFLTGQVGAASLDPIVGIRGVEVVNDSGTVTHTAGAVASGTDAWGAPINASAIGGIVNAGIGATLPLNWGVGTYNQYGQAHANGTSTGASGAVTNAGAVDTGAISGGTAAKVGTLRLSDLTGLGTTLSGLTDVSLNIGAVAAIAQLDGCSDSWLTGPVTSTQLQRSYTVSELRTELTSPAVAALMGPGGTVPTAVATLQTQLDTLIGTPVTNGTAETSIGQAALTSLTTQVEALLGGISSPLATLSAGDGHNVTTAVSVDLTAVNNLLTGTLDDGVVSVNLANGKITADIGLIAGGLNGLAPNTRLVTATQLNNIVDRVDTLVTARLAQINAAITTALNAATVTIGVDVKVKATLLAIFPLPGIGPINALNVHLGYTGSLAQYTAGTQTVSGPTVTILEGTGIGDVVLNPLLNALTAGLLTPVANIVTPAVLSAVTTNLTTPVTGTAATILSNTTALRQATIVALRPLLATLAAIVDVRLNVRPDASPNPAPPYAGVAGEYYQSAVRVGVLNAPGGASILSLYLANASVGANG
jgi:hypothetical protein